MLKKSLLKTNAEHFRRKLAIELWRNALRHTHFSVISNNCWGAHIYQAFKRTYETPFVGLFLLPQCYLQLLDNLESALLSPLRFQESSKYDTIRRWRNEKNHQYPIGVLNDSIEVHFLHYDSQNVALEKWQRRIERVNWEPSKLFVKFCDRDDATTDDLERFNNIALPNKVLFTATPYPQMPIAVHVPQSNGKHVDDGHTLSTFSYKYFDAASWISHGPSCSILSCV